MIGIHIQLKCKSCGHEDWYFDMSSRINTTCSGCKNAIKVYDKAIPAKKRNRPPTIEWVQCS